jgi:V8-like Glu-specific endopeptidase
VRKLILFLFFLPLVSYGYDCADGEFVSVENDWQKNFERILVALTQQTRGEKGHGVDVSAVYGEDTRVEVTNKVFPWTAMGKFGGCTASLVGECTIVTAAHCLNFNDSDKFDNINFTPRFGSASFGAVKVETPKIWRVPSAQKKYLMDGAHPGTDWAVVKVRGRPGKEFGYLGIKSGWTESRSASSLKKFYVAGYSSDYKTGDVLSVDMSAQLIRLGVQNGDLVFRMTVDSGKGASGGAVLDDEGDLIGIQTRAYVENDAFKTKHLPDYETEETATGVPADRFFQAVLKIKEEKCED